MASKRYCEQILAFQMNSDESAFDGNGFNLQTSFNIWRSGKVQQQLHVGGRHDKMNHIPQNASYFPFYGNHPVESNIDSSTSSIKSGKLIT